MSKIILKYANRILLPFQKMFALPQLSTTPLVGADTT